MIRKSKEDYLRVMYELFMANGKVKQIDVAKKLSVSKPCVAKMIKKLENEGYLIRSPGIMLTERGNEIAKTTYNKHNAIVSFLKLIGHNDISEIYDEAHKLEHAFSDKSMGLLNDFMNNHFEKLIEKGNFKRNNLREGRKSEADGSGK